MSKKRLLVSAVIAGILVVLIDLLVERLLNHELVASDYIVSSTVGVLTALAIFVLFRNRAGRSCG